MTFWDFWFKPKTDYWENLYRTEKSRADKLYYDLINCQTENSRILSAVKLAMEGRQNLENQIRNKDAEIQVLTGDAIKNTLLLKNQSADLEDLLKENNKLLVWKVQLAEKVEELQARLAEEITPEKLSAYLITKYPQGTDVSKIWDDYAEALDNAFAAKLLDPIKEIMAGNYRDEILEALPGVKFNNPLMDDRYYRPSVADGIRIIRNDFGNLRPYVPNAGDCDKFAERLRVWFYTRYGLNVGIMLLGNSPMGYHAWFFLVCWDGKIFCEPQNDFVVAFPKIIPGYEAKEVAIA